MVSWIPFCEESARVSRLLEAGSSLPSTKELQVVVVHRQICGATMGKCCCCSVRTVCTLFAVLTMMNAISKVYKDGNEISNYIATDEEEKEPTDEEEREPLSLLFIRGIVLENSHAGNFASGKIMKVSMADVRTFVKLQS